MNKKTNANTAVLERSDDLLNRFLRYVRIDTTSDRHIAAHPSTEGQWELLRLLQKELTEMGINDITLDKEGYLIARIPPEAGSSDQQLYIGLMAHVDTASDCPGKNVNPQIHREYDGGVLSIGSNLELNPKENPELSDCIGHTIITSDGRTLLGADDKAGIAEIMTLADILLSNPALPHCGVEIIFTPDEETGTGMDHFPIEKLKSKCCYTMDGDTLGTIEGECFNAYKVDIEFTGKVIHLGKARGALVNAVAMASSFIEMLPQNESPEATDGRFGYYCPLEIAGGLETVNVEVYLRDFEEQENQRRIETLKHLAKTVESIYNGGTVTVTPHCQYTNMRDSLNKVPHVMAYLEDAISAAGVTPVRKSIRGGTDGSRLTEMGIPTPNVFAGGQNFHSKTEYASLDVMQKAVEVLIHLVAAWSHKED